MLAREKQAKEDGSNYIQPTYFQHMPFNKHCECHHYAPHHHHPQRLLHFDMFCNHLMTME
jgi:hypothetical protein